MPSESGGRVAAAPVVKTSMEAGNEGEESDKAANAATSRREGVGKGDKAGVRRAPCGRSGTICHS